MKADEKKEVIMLANKGSSNTSTAVAAEKQGANDKTGHSIFFWYFLWLLLALIVAAIICLILWFLFRDLVKKLLGLKPAPTAEYDESDDDRRESRRSMNLIKVRNEEKKIQETQHRRKTETKRSMFGSEDGTDNGLNSGTKDPKSKPSSRSKTPKREGKSTGSKDKKKKDPSRNESKSRKANTTTDKK